ncbi:hypothetical protein GBA52_007884 [Prunus armeniaca]|nr:hypothetical protein GBA52_007884 [Prunus armeniaca]
MVVLVLLYTSKVLKGRQSQGPIQIQKLTSNKCTRFTSAHSHIWPIPESLEKPYKYLIATPHRN